MKQKPKQRKRKHTTATQPARYKNNDINEQYHVKHRVGKKSVKVSKISHRAKDTSLIFLGDREDITA
jgi:hypothetical protein|tara:strand:+ start:794 stop:994 length:201 start_codon:yes stop_codon:yes gene_type:complete